MKDLKGEKNIDFFVIIYFNLVSISIFGSLGSSMLRFLYGN